MKKKTTTTKSDGPALVKTYETEIEYTCPFRGKVKQKVKVKRYETVDTTTTAEVLVSSNITDKLDLQYSGLMLDDDSLEDEENGNV